MISFQLYSLYLPHPCGSGTENSGKHFLTKKTFFLANDYKTTVVSSHCVSHQGEDNEAQGLLLKFFPDRMRYIHASYANFAT